MPPPDAEREAPARPPDSNTLDFGYDYSPVSQPDVPRCWVCHRAPALYVGTDGRHVHKACEPAHVGLTDPPTSRAAAARTSKGPGGALAVLLLAELRDHGGHGATDDELSAVFADQSPGSVAKRRLDLCRAGLVIDSGRTRLTRFGRDAIVWKAIS